MGGAYLTLLNTIANMGVILPKTPAFALIDLLTVVKCVPPPGRSGGPASYAELAPLACPKKPRDMAGANECTSSGGLCEAAMDGFYVVSLCLAFAGVYLGLLYRRLFPALIALPFERWRAPVAAAKRAR
jgi:hypothetical protein